MPITSQPLEHMYHQHQHARPEIEQERPMTEHPGPLAPDAPTALAAIRQHIETEFDLLGNNAHAILRSAEGEVGHLFQTVLDRYSRLQHLVTRLENTLELVLEHDKQCTAQTPANITLTAQETK